MLLDQSKTSGGINLFYAGRNAADLGEEYYRQQQELEGSTGIQRATQTGFAAFGLHSYRNLKSGSTNYSRSLGQALTPGRGFTSGLGVGYMLFGGDDPLEDTAQALGTGAIFKIAGNRNLIGRGKKYGANVIDAFTNDISYGQAKMANSPGLSKFYKNDFGYNNANLKSLAIKPINFDYRTSTTTGVTPYISNSKRSPYKYSQSNYNTNKGQIGQMFSLKRKMSLSPPINKAQRLAMQSEMLNLSRSSQVNLQMGAINRPGKLSRNLKRTPWLEETMARKGLFPSTNISAGINAYTKGGGKQRSVQQILTLANNIGQRAKKDRTIFNQMKRYFGNKPSLAGPGLKPKVLSGAAGVAALVGYGTYKVAEAAFDTFQKGLNLAQNSSRLDFGDGMAFNSGEAMSERQRALQAMANSNMNARSFLGEEAKFYS